MAAATSTITIKDIHNLGRLTRVGGTITLTGDYVAGGVPTDLLAASGPPRTHGAKQPIEPVRAEGSAGFIYRYVVSTKKLMVFTNSAGGVNGAMTEHSAVALVAGVTGDTIYFEAWFPLA